ncbi:MAG: hypothetical protein DLM69_05515, partial [Candidatus Chloroheliales bacterium]
HQPWDADAYAKSLLLTADSEPLPVEHVTFETVPAEAKSVDAQSSARSRASDGSPLQPGPQHSALTQALADAAADIGVAPGDDAILREFARVAAELGVEGLDKEMLDDQSEP